MRKAFSFLIMLSLTAFITCKDNPQSENPGFLEIHIHFPSETITIGQAQLLIRHGNTTILEDTIFFYSEDFSTNISIDPENDYFVNISLFEDSQIKYSGSSSSVAIQSGETTVVYINIGLTIPSTPSNLVANVLSSAAIKLTWEDNSVNENGFIIWREVGESSIWDSIQTVSQDTSIYFDEGLDPLTVYSYRITAYNDSGISGYSNLSTGTTTNPSYIYLAYEGLRILDISNVDYISEVGYYPTIHAYKLCVRNDIVYMTIGYEGLGIFNIAEPKSIENISNYDTDHAWGLFVINERAFVADVNSGLWIINVSNPYIPFLESNYSVQQGNSAQSLVVQGNYAYVAYGVLGLYIFDIQDFSSPTIVGHCETSGGGIEDIAISNNFAYLSSGSGLSVCDITNPFQPSEIAYLSINCDYTYCVEVDDNYAYLISGYSINNSGLRIINISIPSNPYEVGFFCTSSSSNDLVINNNMAFLACLFPNHGLKILDVSDPKSIFNQSMEYEWRWECIWRCVT